MNLLAQKCSESSNGTNDFDTKWILKVFPKGRKSSEQELVKVRVECLNEVYVDADINLFAIKNRRKYEIELTNVKRKCCVGFARRDRFTKW